MSRSVVTGPFQDLCQRAICAIDAFVDKILAKSELQHAPSCAIHESRRSERASRWHDAHALRTVVHEQEKSWQIEVTSCTTTIRGQNNMKTSLIATTIALGLLFRANVAHADLVPPGGEGVNACRDKKAGADCQNYVITEDKQVIESGTCVEEKLDHLRFKFKAHLRCVSASVPKPAVSAAAPSASAAATPPEMPSAAPVIPSAAPVAPAPIAPASATPEAPKSSGCSFGADPSSGVAFCFTLLGLGVLVHGRRRRNQAHSNQ